MCFIISRVQEFKSSRVQEISGAKVRKRRKTRDERRNIFSHFSLPNGFFRHFAGNRTYKKWQKLVLLPKFAPRKRRGMDGRLPAAVVAPDVGAAFGVGLIGATTFAKTHIQCCGMGCGNDGVDLDGLDAHCGNQICLFHFLEHELS